jgi:hypothetical protein
MRMDQKRCSKEYLGLKFQKRNEEKQMKSFPKSSKAAKTRSNMNKINEYNVFQKNSIIFFKNELVC